MEFVVQLEILNSGSHFSQEQYSLAIVQFILLIVFIFLAFVNYGKYMEDKQKLEEEDSPLFFTFGSLCMTAISCFLKCAHNIIYVRDGVGSVLCNMFSHVMMVFSRITAITLLIALAFGWQVIYENTQQVKNKIQWIYILVLVLTIYDDWKLSKWIEEHPADLFKLM